MTIEEFGQTIKQKYPQYKNYSDSEIGQKMLQKYPQYQNQITQPKEADNRSTTQKVVSGVAVVAGGKQLALGGAELLNNTAEKSMESTLKDAQSTDLLIQEAKKLPPGARRTQLLKYANEIARGNTSGQEALKSLPTNKEVLGSAAQLGMTLGTLGTAGPLGNTGKAIADRIGQGALIGSGFGAAQGLENNQSLGGVAKSAALGGALGGITTGGIEFAKWAVKGVPKLLSYTSSTPETVLQRNYDNPEAMGKATKYLKTHGEEQVRSNVQTAERQLRTNLSKQWDEGAKALIDTNQGVRAGFNQSQQKLITKVADEFGIDIPQNMNSMSTKEFLALNKEINSLYAKPIIRAGEKGVIVRKAKDLLDGLGQNYPGVGEFLSNYGTEKQVLDAVSQLVNPYNKLPKAQATALSTLKNAFNENKSAYISAIKDLEDKTGIKVLDQVAALSTKKIMPKGSVDILTRLLKPLALPLTSPRGAALASRIAGRIGNLNPQALEKLLSLTGGKIGALPFSQKPRQ